MEDPNNSAPPPSGALTTSGGVSPRLESLLRAGLRDEDSAVEEIARTPVLADQARGMLEHLKRVATAPAGEIGLQRVLGVYFVTYPQPERSDAEWLLWWGPYIETCGHISAPALDAAMRTWVAMPDSEFLPKPGKLRELAMTVRNPATMAHLIAHKGVLRAEELARLAAAPQLSRHEIQALPELQVRAMPTDAQRASVRGMAAQFAAQVQADKPERPVLPPTPVTFAPGTHISPEMIEAMRRQDPEWRPAVEADQGEPDPGMFS